MSRHRPNEYRRRVAELVGGPARSPAAAPTAAVVVGGLLVCGTAVAVGAGLVKPGPDGGATLSTASPQVTPSAARQAPPGTGTPVAGPRPGPARGAPPGASGPAPSGPGGPAAGSGSAGGDRIAGHAPARPAAHVVVPAGGGAIALAPGPGAAAAGTAVPAADPAPDPGPALPVTAQDIVWHARSGDHVDGPRDHTDGPRHAVPGPAAADAADQDVAAARSWTAGDTPPAVRAAADGDCPPAVDEVPARGHRGADPASGADDPTLPALSGEDGGSAPTGGDSAGDADHLGHGSASAGSVHPRPYAPPVVAPPA